MSLFETEKIFVEPSDELPQIIETIIKSKKDRVILVIPLSSVLVCSILTMKILFYEVVKHKKNVIIVTEDNYGFFVAQKVGFVVVRRLSQITSDLWEVSLERILSTYKKYFGSTSVSDELISMSNYQNSFDDSSSKSLFNVELDDKHSNDNYIDTGERSESNEVIDESVNSSSYAKKDQIFDTDSDFDNVDINIIKRQQKVVLVDGIEIYGGGDINKLHLEDSVHVKIQNQDLNLNDDMNNNSLIGRDFHAKVNKKGIKNIFSMFRLKKNSLRSEDNKVNKRKKILFFFILASFFLIFLSIGLFVYDSINVEIVIELKPEVTRDLQNQAIIGNALADNLDLNNLSIPIAKFQIDNIGSTKSATATGKKLVGTKSKGFVTIYNTTSPARQISLTAGTKLKNISTNLEFVILQDTLIEAPQIGTAGELTAGILEDIPVEAIEIGSQYNLTISPGDTLKFVVEGFQNTQVSATAFTSFEGGSSEEIIIVSEEDVSKIEKEILDVLKTEAVIKLKNVTPSGFVFVNNALKFTNKRIVSTPDIGNSSSDNIFTVDVEVDAIGYFARQDYINEIAKHILRQQKNNDENLDVVGIKSVELELVDESFQTSNFNENNIKLSLKTVGIFKAVVDLSEIRLGVLGKSVNDAIEIIKSNKDIDNVRVGYLPFFIPDNLRYIPLDQNKVKVRVI